VNPAVIQLAFDPVLRLTDTASVRFETLALAGVVFIALLLAAWFGRRTPAPVPYVPAPGLPAEDVVFIVIGAIPGAVIGGRLGYVLDHLGYYQVNPGSIADPAQGALTLTLAVPLGILSGAVIARLVGAPVGRWMHAAALPLLFVLAAGRLVGVLGATGQGLPSDLPWATAYAGPGPWDALAPGIASHPAQVYEAIGVGLAVIALAAIAPFGVIARRDGAALFAAVGLWAIVRFLVAFTWRDPVVAGPLRFEQVLDIGLVVIAAIGLFERARAPVRSGLERQREADPEPA
jgi:phosphatidylglycerol---prolipoprotein diacylglyceryl transferase